MKKDVGPKGDLKILPLLLAGGALFSMHFGASSMVWPMNWGKESGTSYLLAFAGAFITSLFLVLIGYIALARGKGTYRELTERVCSKKFTFYFTALTILVNGPLYVIPRMSAAAWDSFLQAFGLSFSSRLPLIVFTILFYIVAYLFLMSPGKAMDRISSFLFPVLMIIVAAVIGKGIFYPGELQTKQYAGNAFAYGFTNGYATGEILCALIFGAVILNNLREKGIGEERLTGNMVRVGLVGLAILTLTHFFHMKIGASFASVYPDLSYTSLYTAVATHLYGKAGGILFFLALLMAALTTAIGMTSGCAEFFVELTDKRFSYRQIALAIVILSVLFGSLGLAGILSILGPVLDGVYPAAMVLVIYFGLVRDPGASSNRRAAGNAIYTAFAMGMLDMIWKYLVRFGMLESLCRVYEKIPLASVSLLWVPVVLVVYLLSLIIKQKKKSTI